MTSPHGSRSAGVQGIGDGAEKESVHMKRCQKKLNDCKHEKANVFAKQHVVAKQPGRGQEARELYQTVIADKSKMLGKGHVSVLDSKFGLAKLLGQLVPDDLQIEKLLDEVRQGYAINLGDDHTKTVEVERELARCRKEPGNPPDNVATPVSQEWWCNHPDCKSLFQMEDCVKFHPHYWHVPKQTFEKHQSTYRS